MIGQSAAEIGSRQLDIEADRLAVIGNGMLGIAARVIGAGPAHVAGHVLRGEADREIVAGDGTLVVSLGEIRVATVEIGPHMSWVDSDRDFEIGDRLVELAELAVGDAAVGMKDGEIGPFVAAAIEQRCAGGSLLCGIGCRLSGAAAHVVLRARTAGTERNGQCDQQKQTAAGNRRAGHRGLRDRGEPIAFARLKHHRKAVANL